MSRSSVILVLVCSVMMALTSSAQTSPTQKVEELKQDTVKKKRPKYYRSEEIIYDNKRYRLYNSYVVLGPAFANSTIRTQSQKGIGLDFHWHIRRQYFQTGVNMSGLNFGDNNHVGAHIGAGYRKEGVNYLIGGFVGPSYGYGVEGSLGSAATFYNSYGIYFAVHAVTKFIYDMGLGLEVFGDVSSKQSIFGVKIVAMFSGAYKGPKRNYNANVRAENPKWQK